MRSRREVAQDHGTTTGDPVRFLPYSIDRRNATPSWGGRYYEGVEWDCVAKYGSLTGLVELWERDYVYRIRDRRGRVIWMGRGRPPRSLTDKEGT